MSDQFLAEIRIFPFGFAPAGWAMCNGQLLPIRQNTSLFGLIGTTYGGDGKTTFALPDLEANVPLCVTAMQGSRSPPPPPLSQYLAGQFGGEQTHTLLDQESPRHIHNISGDTAAGTASSPANAIYRQGIFTGNPPGAVAPYSTKAPDVQLSNNALALTGGGQPHNNMMPYLTLNFCIALSGIYPPRS